MLWRRSLGNEQPSLPDFKDVVAHIPAVQEPVEEEMPRFYPRRAGCDNSTLLLSFCVDTLLLNLTFSCYS